MTNSSDPQAVAEEYVERGFALIPLQPKGKIPHYSLLASIYGSPTWKHLEKHPASIAAVREWLSHDSETNIGIITGNASSLVVADFDDPTLSCTHPVTPEVRTSRGKHLYFFAANVDFTSVSHSLAGEIRANGHYVVAPPSQHQSGHQYRWGVSLVDASLADWDSFKDHSLVRQAFRSQEKAKKQTNKEINQTDTLTTQNPKPPQPLYCDPPSLGQLRGVVEIVAQHLGIKTVLHESRSTSFHCILPGHEENNPSATFYRHPESGIWLYKDHHREGSCYTLADVWASFAGGHTVKLTSPSTALYWYGRLFAECGIIEPVQIPIRTPPGCSEATQRVADGLSLLMGIRELLNPGEPTPFSHSFAELWSGVTKKQHQLGMKQLEKLGSIKRVGIYKMDGVKECILWEAT